MCMGGIYANRDFPVLQQIHVGLQKTRNVSKYETGISQLLIVDRNLKRIIGVIFAPRTPVDLGLESFLKRRETVLPNLPAILIYFT